LQLQEKFAGTQDKYIIGVYNQALANKQAIGTQLMNQLVALRNQQSAEAISNRNTARDFSNTRLLNADEFNYQQQLANAARGGGS
jgi:hypothetical protein